MLKMKKLISMLVMVGVSTNVFAEWTMIETSTEGTNG
jgi:hypothetical protein